MSSAEDVCTCSMLHSSCPTKMKTVFDDKHCDTDGVLVATWLYLGMCSQTGIDGTFSLVGTIVFVLTLKLMGSVPKMYN